MTSQKALHVIYCYWLTTDNSFIGQLILLILAYNIRFHSHRFHNQDLLQGNKWKSYRKTSTEKTFRSNSVLLCLITQLKPINVTKTSSKRLRIEIRKPSTKYIFYSFILSQSHLFLFNQSGSSPPGINRLLNHCAIFC